MIEAQNGAATEEFKEGDHELRASDIVIRKFNINMGMKNVNPLEKVSFYREVDGEYQKVQKDPAEISKMMAENCQRTIVRCFLKDESKFELAQNAFKQFCVEKLGGEALMSRYHSHS